MSKRTFVILFVLVLLVGGILRLYNHGDWLMFHLDQSRDALLMWDVYHGERELPHLGPHARSSEAELGPVFYYFQWIATLLFGPSPEVAAWPDLLFSLLTIPFFYLFCRLAFSRSWSLLLTLLLSASAYLVVYGRFAWNPNSIPFFLILGGYALIMYQHATDSWKRWAWLSISAIAFVVTSQLHFIAFFALPIFFVLYVFLTQPRTLWGWIQPVFVFFIVTIVLYIPWLIVEFEKDWKNTNALVTAVFEKGSRNDNHNIIEKGYRALQKTSKNVSFVTVGYHASGLVKTKHTPVGWQVRCDEKCRNALKSFFTGLLILIGGLFLILQKLWRRKSDTEEGGTKERNFYVYVLTWGIGSMIVLTLLAYQISTRFFLVLAPFFLVLFVILVKWIGERFFGDHWRVPFYILVFGIALLGQAVTLGDFFSEMRDAKTLHRSFGDDHFLERNYRVSLEQQREITAFISEDARQKNLERVVVVVDNVYARSFYYLLKTEEKMNACYIKRSALVGEETMNAYIVVRKETSEYIPDGYPDRHHVEVHQFGTLVLNIVEPKDGSRDEETVECRTR